MRSLLNLLAVFLVCVFFTSSVQAEKIALGPASVYVDMSLVPEPFVQVRAPYSDFHAISGARINCTVYAACIGDDDVTIQLHHLARPIEISPIVLRQFMADSLLIPAAWSFSDARSTLIGGQVQGYEGILVEAFIPEGFPIRVTAFCPRLEAKKGDLICLARSSLCPRCNRALLDSMRVDL